MNPSPNADRVRFGDSRMDRHRDEGRADGHRGRDDQQMTDCRRDSPLGAPVCESGPIEVKHRMALRAALIEGAASMGTIGTRNEP
jgi:hypothetical protein